MKRGIIHPSSFASMMRHNFICDKAIMHGEIFSHTIVNVLSQSFKVTGQLNPAKLHILKFKIFDVCSRPFLQMQSHIHT